MSSMGDSTRRRLAAVVHNANAMGAPGAAGTSHGGYGGGMGGSFGKASRGLNSFGKPAVGSDGTNARPASAGRARPSPAAYHPPSPSGPRPTPTHHKAVWENEPRSMPRASPHNVQTVRARTQSESRARPPTEKMDYKLEGRGVAMQGGGSGGPAPRPSSATQRPQTPSTPMKDRKSVDGSAAVTPPARARTSNSGARLSSSGGAEGGAPAITEAHMTALEDQIRDAIRDKRSVYEGSKEMLLKHFKAVDDGSGDVDIEEFRDVCSRIGVTVSAEEAQALFRRLGFESVMPYQKFATALLTQPSRQIAEDLPVRKGAFQAGQSANFNGKVLYKPCRTGVYTPSDWDPSLAERSSELPDARLVLEFVYGYQGKDNTSQNLFFTGDNNIVYFTAGVGVVYQRPPVHHQYFFLGHADDISALALCSAPIDFDGRSFPAKTLVATGQVTSVEEGAYICIWDSRNATQNGGPAAVTELTRLKFSKEDAGFCALAFSPSGTRLACVAMDNYHSVYVYDWRKQRVLSNGRGQSGDPPQVYGLEWNPYEITHNCPSAFVTFGKKHIKMWTCGPDASSWTPKSMAFGRLAMQNVTSAQWLPPRANSNESLVVAGVADGQLYLFKGTSAVKAITAHRPGPNVLQSDGRNAYHGVRGLRGVKNGTVLLSGGADGQVLQWDTADGNVQDSRFVASAIQLSSPLGPNDKSMLPCIRALDYSSDIDRIIVGTSNCDIMELTSSTEPQVTLMDGHSGDVYHMAFHPTKPNVFATVADSGQVHLWDTHSRQMTHCVPMNWQPRAVAFSSLPIGAGHHVAVGGSKGDITILDEAQNLRPIHSTKEGKEGVADLKYSPSNRTMAVSTFDTFVDVYNVEKGYQRIGRCNGHSATVRGVDWSADSSIIISNSNDYELLYWNAKTGKQITQPQRDLEYHSYTSIFGFGVMGIWPPFSTGTDINSLDRSKNSQWVATSDDHGMVKLFNYPCVVADAPHRAYRGHSSHIMGIRFNCNDSLVCSAGGHDWAVFQFKIVEVAGEAPPPPKKEKVWGALDPAGRNYGYTTDPVELDQPPRPDDSAPAPAPAHASRPPTSSGPANPDSVSRPHTASLDAPLVRSPTTTPPRSPQGPSSSGGGRAQSGGFGSVAEQGGVQMPASPPGQPAGRSRPVSSTGMSPRPTAVGGDDAGIPAIDETLAPPLDLDQLNRLNLNADDSF